MKYVHYDILTIGTLSQLDEEQLRLEAELESVRRELDIYNNTNPVAVKLRTSSTDHYSSQHLRSASSLDNNDHYSRRRYPYRQGDSADHRLGRENPFYGAHMMQMLLDQQAKIYSKETEMLRKEMEQLKVSCENYHLNAIILCC